VAAAVFLAGASPARAWWNSEWTLRKQVTVDTSGSGVPISDPLGATPVLLRLHDGDFRFADAKQDGTDLRFVSVDDKTLLSYHIEKFDSLLDEAFIWVNVPGLKPGGKTTFWLYYGNAGNSAAKVESAKDTYDADTALVYHFNERGQPAYDFTGQGNNAQNSGLSVDGSMIGTGLRLDGRTAISIPAASSLSWQEGGSMTWSAWVKFGQPQAQAIFFSRKDGANVMLFGSDSGVPFVALTYQGTVVRSSAGAPVAPQSWHHVAVTASGARIEIYLDGDPYASVNASLPNLNGPSLLGGDASAVANGVTGFVGEMDELEISRVARSAAFIKFEAAEQGGDSGSKVVSLGLDEQPTNWLSFLKKGYVGVIIGSLTLDGWLVIGLLAVMSLISWLVMISKAAYLNKAGKGNVAFLKEWRQMGNDFSALESKSTADPVKIKAPAHRTVMRQSPLFHVYKLGVDEIRRRLDDDRGGGGGGVKVISVRSIESIRATLDGGLVRESQRLSSQMVLLTIAISGGPFLGLLGTVVGVMITFAAVAQAGDVNVNAIAPGIAAALAATVAGLAVAIPALFGYNYLLTQIKTMTSDMHVFVDEFITKMAEYYHDGPD
jgi:biopolymer transport protein ExbB